MTTALHSPVYEIVDDGFCDRLGEFCGSEARSRYGIYRLWSALPDGSPRPVGRLLGTDAEGTLYLGCSINVVRRMGDLRKAVLTAYGTGRYTNDASHTAGRRMKAPFLTSIPLEALRVQITLLPPEHRDVDKAQLEQERTALDTYYQQFGETPPLNAMSS